MQSQAQGNDPSMKMMKYMMYSMPLIFFFVFNDYAAGLSYYYFVSLLMTIIQTYIFRWTLNDERVLADMKRQQEKRAKQPKKKSSFMERMEKMQRERQAMMREQIKQQSKKR